MKNLFDEYMLCCNCGCYGKQKVMFLKDYERTAISLCKNCAKELCEELNEYLEEKPKEKY